MFGLFSSVEKRMRTTARHWVELGDKILAYRRDQLSAAERTEVTSATESVRRLVKEKADASRLKLATESLEEVLRRHGGKFYPRSVIQEYVEFFVVAAIVILGLRAYYVQPFKIPTNSMWPTYYGMTPEVFRDADPSPNGLERVGRLLAFGASYHEVIAPKSGKIFVPIIPGGSGTVAYQKRAARKFFMFPGVKREYVFNIGGDTFASLLVPEDFDLSPVIHQAFGLKTGDFAELEKKARFRDGNFLWIELPIEAVAGKPIVRFDILTGDQLFVDRVSYHFVKPSVGEGFVFRTGHIDELSRDRGDQYYIKRLAGTPGDKLEIREPVLYRNGSPITGAQAFQDNAAKKFPYAGYFNARPYNGGRFLLRGDTIEVPQHRYLALGDNSGNSLDSRYWGFVPYKDVVGRPLFIYYPFTKRAGLAR
ncbi:signal peptidase I [Nibricoccus sp. IMCC34717]|uniref:signal peptidase I n=1 Tax=Nibricoccus sp. IMCC34717 TaxID=3034021 RepID=UPI00384D9A5D